MINCLKIIGGNIDDGTKIWWKRRREDFPFRLFFSSPLIEKSWIPRIRSVPLPFLPTSRIGKRLVDGSKPPWLPMFWIVYCFHLFSLIRLNTNRGRKKEKLEFYGLGGCKACFPRSPDLDSSYFRF